MTDKPNDGGPAYPTLHIPDSSPPAWSGMSLRDYFAGQALAGLCVGCAGMLGKDFSPYAKGPCNSALADRAFVVADAMLAERDKED